MCFSHWLRTVLFLSRLFDEFSVQIGFCRQNAQVKKKINAFSIVDVAFFRSETVGAENSAKLWPWTPFRFTVDQINIKFKIWNANSLKLTLVSDFQPLRSVRNGPSPREIGVVALLTEINNSKVKKTTTNRWISILSVFFSAMIQLIAASQADRPLVYITFRDQILVDTFYEVYQYLQKEKATVQHLCNYLQNYSKIHTKMTLFEYILQTPISSLWFFFVKSIFFQHWTREKLQINVD